MSNKPVRRKRKKRSPGRPVTLTPEIQQKLCQALIAGNYIETACMFAKISKSAFYDWLQRGEDGEEQFLGFSDAVRDAIAQGEMRLVMSVEKAATGRPAKKDPKTNTVLEEGTQPDWKAASWMLERKFPDRWGKREQVKLFGADPGEKFKPEGDYEKFLEFFEDLDKKKK